MIIYKKIASTLLFILPLFALNACHQKGCTNKDAINFNVTADQDDGSCIYCNQQTTNISSKTAFLTDNNFSSPFFNQKVARFDLTEPEITYSVSQCGKTSCTVNLTITNLISKNMVVSYSLFNQSGPLFISSRATVTINTNSALNEGVIKTFSSPPYTPVAADSIVVSTFSNISYF